MFQIRPSADLLLINTAVARDTHRHPPSSPSEWVSHRDKLQYLWDSTVIPDITLVGKHVSYVAQFSFLHVLLNWV